MSNNFTSTEAIPPVSSGVPAVPPTVTYSASEFTSQGEIERVYSTIGVTLRLDDLNEENASDMMDEIVSAATETVASYTLRYYNNSAIYTSPWVRRRATIIACYYLSMRRANGTQFTNEYQRIMEELEKFLGPTPPFIPGPDGLPSAVRASMIPTISSYIIDDRNRYKKLRVSKDYSTKPYPGQLGYVQPLAQDYT